MRKASRLCRLVCGIALLVVGRANAEPTWATPLAPFFQTQCFDCHTGEGAKGGLDLNKLGTDLNNAELLRRWVRIHDRVSSGEMPPQDAPRPDEQAKKQFLALLSDSLTRADLAVRDTVLRWLNRTEYENTMVMFGSDLGNGSSHDNHNLPIILAGGGFRHGQHLAFDRDNNYPLPNLYVSMLQQLGLESDRFASSTGTMTGLS